ncbi:alpha/beta hydrolase [Mycolicibacterium vaccae]|uniref:Alpha/beta hydrolase fold protein n=1 Tax=Mycolicibacterium vaccae ATCC 25954 TaxID=1194972 RepID=K0USB5_MYCVA|nr:alpha/beta fold hydrolase [Mycolicibacterium vaccae]ANI39062.1 alpha/beta hydrolase [Mycolicibacterium vaccae 95051]EJZ09992.1 alpha/beta hydrolase fold protein [Mycolicibacterium vaccae ATCC 25954]MCV7064277.1 alpha/beta fold hydrolase [Mycolicibacterium vaccae]
MTRSEISFPSGADACSAWHFAADGDLRPVVVMAHGFGGTKDSGLEPFARHFAAAGIDVFAFDYRGFGASGGVPRQSLSVTRQIDDYHAAVSAAKTLEGVDPTRIALWGASFSGGHVIRVAAERDDIGAVIALTPLTSGLAVSRAAATSRDLVTSLRWTLTGVKSRLAVRRGGAPTLMPLVSPVGEPGALALDGAYESYTALAGPTWRNEIDCAVGLEVVGVRTTAAAKKLRVPLLVQIADFDQYVPASAVAATAEAGRAQVHHYPCDHFDVWPGNDWFDKTVADQTAFLARTFSVVRGALVD